MNIKIPVSWLRDYLKTDAAAKTIAKELSLSGPSVERIEKRANDYVFDIEVTTNRLDAFSVYGIAREAYAILAYRGQKTKLVQPPGLDLNLEPDTKERLALNVKVTNPTLCPRFTAIVLSNIKVGASPAYIKNRLEISGIRSINNIVDITNYVMLETGNPMHAFDYDKIKGSLMILRSSREGEKITTLDGKTYKLPQGAIVIQDQSRIIDLCGIMGGENSQITRRTSRVVFFVQSYDPQAVRKTTQAIAVRTEAASRFEKSVDQENIPAVLARAVYLAKKTASAKIASELIDIYPKKQNAKSPTLNLGKLTKYLGIKLEPADVSKILTHLGFKVTVHPAQISALAPSWRAQDIENDVDLIEEIARIYGYHNLPLDLPIGETPSRQDSELKRVINLKSALMSQGLTETISYSIISKNMLSFSATSEKNAVELANPLTDQWQFMRPSLIPSLVEIVAQNVKQKAEIQLFEVAKTYIKQKNSLPTQDLHLAICKSDGDFYQIKGLNQNLASFLKQDFKYQKLDAPDSLFDQNQTAIVKIKDEEVGKIGMLGDSLLKNFGLETQVAAIDLNLSAIYMLPTLSRQFHQLPKHPPLIEDISAIFYAATPVASIIAEIKNSSDFVKNVEIIDIFEDTKIGEGKKSITLRLIYQKLSGTPTQEEVNRQREKITGALETNLRAKVRK